MGTLILYFCLQHTAAHKMTHLPLQIGPIRQLSLFPHLFPPLHQPRAPTMPGTWELPARGRRLAVADSWGRAPTRGGQPHQRRLLRSNSPVWRPASPAPPAAVELPRAEAGAVALPAPPPGVELSHAEAEAAASPTPPPGVMFPVQRSGLRPRNKLPYMTGSLASGSMGPFLRTSSIA
jgi:hypothetical protein